MTLTQIAKEVGVSPSIISHYMNGNFSKMSDKTKQKVEAKVKELGYQVNPVAKGLITGKMNTIALLWSFVNEDLYLEDLYYTHFAKVLKKKLKKQGYKLMLIDEDEFISTLPMIDGIILKATNKSERYMENICNKGINVVTIGRHNLAENAHVVRANDIFSGRQGIDFLLSRGYDDIMLLTYPKKEVAGFDDRLNGASQRLWEEGIPAKVINGNMTEEFGIETVKRLSTMNKLPKAFFCFNDLTAIGIIKGCKEMGLKIPEDIAVLGVDDTPVISELLGLSTLRHPIDELASIAASLVIEKNKDNHYRDVVLDTILMERETV